ncbi:MAG: hypothetical protein KAR19_19030 [Bacteroidales bacterium]|nr:hypothetical protein [Bacteroidales bacterium]
MRLLFVSNRHSVNHMMFLAALLLFAHGSFARADGDNIIIGKTVTISSEILDEDRTMLVYLPPGYEQATEEYPVLYLLDGETHFLHGSGIVQYLSRLGLIPQMIVVAITNVDRTRDFSPTHDQRLPTSGGAEKFLSFLDSELIPHVDEYYRTANFRILMGHSFGGTFATFSLLNNPELFNAHIAISPYLHYDNNYLIKQSKTKLKSKYKTHKFFYMTVGYEINYFEPLKEFYTILEEKSGRTIDFQYTIMEKEDHGTIPHLSIYNGLKYIFSDFILPEAKIIEGLVAVDAHYSNVTDKYGYTVEAPEITINILGYRYLQNNDLENAIHVFKENTKRYPKSANVYDSLGEAYENNDQMDLAEVNYQKAYDLGIRNNDPNAEVFHTNLLRVRGNKQ